MVGVLRERVRRFGLFNSSLGAIASVLLLQSIVGAQQEVPTLPEVVVDAPRQ